MPVLALSSFDRSDIVGANYTRRAWLATSPIVTSAHPHELHSPVVGTTLAIFPAYAYASVCPRRK